MQPQKAQLARGARTYAVEKGRLGELRLNSLENNWKWSAKPLLRNGEIG
jgi:hypothetical protein